MIVIDIGMHGHCASPVWTVAVLILCQVVLTGVCDVLLLVVYLQEKDRAKFGPEYGDRFCMLQLVGRHEMDKVQLQHESETVQKVRTLAGH
jgi:hypothetical protein